MSINPINPHSYFKDKSTTAVNDCGYEINYTLEGETILTKKFYKNDKITTVQITIDKIGNVKTTTNTKINNLKIATKNMDYKLETTASNGFQAYEISNLDPLQGEGFLLNKTNNFNDIEIGSKPNSYHGYYTQIESDELFLSKSDLIGIWAGVTLPAFFASLAVVIYFFYQIRKVMPFGDDNVIFVSGVINESKTENKFSLRQNAWVLNYEGTLQTGTKGERGYSYKKK